MVMDATVRRSQARCAPERGERAPGRRDTSLDLGPLPRLMGYALRRAQLAVFQDFHEHFAKHDISPAQFSVLTVLRHNPGASQSQVSDALGVKRANFVPLLDTLERRGLAERRRVTGDRRVSALFLTEPGKDLTRRLERIAIRHEQPFIERIGEEARAQLLLMLARLADAEPGR